MDEPRPVYDYLQLGMTSWYLQNPSTADARAYRDEIDRFAARLTLCRMPATLNAVSPLQVGIPYDPTTGRITRTAAQQLYLAMSTIRQTLEGEAIKQKTIVLDLDGVSARLRKVGTEIPFTTAQINLLNETTLDIECGAYRSAVVMAWNFAYDYIRQWLFDNKLVEFNSYLTANYLDKVKDPVFDPINDYADFFKRDAPGEKVVLKSMFKASIIGEVVYEQLSHYLRQRNDYAHSNSKALSRDQANAYIEHLLTIIAEPPFPQPTVSVPVTPVA